MSKPTFIIRSSNQTQPKDYISQANDRIRENGTIDPESPLYQSALNQYNASLIRGTVERLEVPPGFCGYIDPKTGQFRVERELLLPDGSKISLEDDFGDIPNDQPLLAIPYPIDECLQNGLPGSYEYTEKNCGDEDGDNKCSGVQWYNTTTFFGSGASTQTVCTTGAGVNSNISIATSTPVGGVSPEYPDPVWWAADSAALALYSSAGAVEKLFNVMNLLGYMITHQFFFNVNDPDNMMGPKFWKEAGLRVQVSWDTRTWNGKQLDPVKIYDVRYQKMWLWDEGEVLPAKYDSTGNYRFDEAWAGSLGVVGGDPDEFLYEPTSTTNGKFVILLPASYVGYSVTVFVGNIDFPTTYSGTNESGRSIYRGSVAGEDLLGSIRIEASKNGQSTKSWTVPDSSRRYKKS